MARKSQYQVATINTPPTSIPGEFQTSVAFSSGTTSTVLHCGGTTPVALLISSSIAAANLSFMGSKDGQTFYTITDFDGNAFAIPAAGSATQWIPLQPAQFCGVIYLQIVSSNTQTGLIDFALAPIFQGVHA